MEMERVRRLLEEYLKAEERIQAAEVGDPLSLFYVKKSQLAQIEGKIRVRLQAVQEAQSAQEQAL
jgi:hypothetical protein